MRYDQIPSALRAAREAAGLTQEQIAERIGVTRPRVSQIEIGYSDPGLRLLCSWIDACGAELEVVPRLGPGEAA